ncbi:MAG: pyrroloquinoline quinone biosynthesis protein PqqB [Acidiphilium sp. 37-64-53]|uniref:pyrroloquinoline quinone biosynthesis protein PqqB n=1 Tax=Acidiphilium TaxID=522 RepID=UPI000BD9F7DE|nr:MULTISPECIES: pyrroloquinoline quinone biosynthesis protein PqqB [Acidiphilium]OYW03958.1 MAG: pyrroloquinoline quinone biosynthesis protein PqqB [Acidiphilium sp. 37-64-53]OZB27028.1 MAG: pyrroloquinoline quinone biosynthesis protein PqqB [Acidiphilium sp. 34-64-41]HQT83874.1 pyrroloquinoline quinone biosynthesis protein PqqB [Acidiphilium rubrum]
MKLIILGAAAGGGFPQWNCACRNCARARSGDPAARPRTQAAIAVSGNGSDYVIFNASPDLREQILATKALHPRQGLRDSPIAAVVLTGGDVDFTAGLLNLREGQRFALYAGQRILDLLDASVIFRVLAPDLVPRRRLDQNRTTPLQDAAGQDLGITVEPFAVPGKVALYAEDTSRADLGSSEGDTLGVKITGADGACLYYIPACAAVTPDLAARLRGAPVVLFDGTLWHDNEMIDAGLLPKTGRRMGHISVSGPDGTLAAMEGLGIGRKIFVHINNSNPMILDDSPEREQAERAGWIVAHDGLELNL